MIIKEELSERAVMKREWAQVSVSSREKKNTKRNFSESDH